MYRDDLGNEIATTQFLYALDYISTIYQIITILLMTGSFWYIIGIKTTQLRVNFAILMGFSTLSAIGTLVRQLVEIPPHLYFAVMLSHSVSIGWLCYSELDLFQLLATISERLTLKLSNWLKVGVLVVFLGLGLIPRLYIVDELGGIVSAHKKSIYEECTRVYVIVVLGISYTLNAYTYIILHRLVKQRKSKDTSKQSLEYLETLRRVYLYCMLWGGLGYACWLSGRFIRDINLRVNLIQIGITAAFWHMMHLLYRHYLIVKVLFPQKQVKNIPVPNMHRSHEIVTKMPAQ
jgi:hypothetical protein